MVFTLMLMGQNMKDIGEMTCNMEMELKLGLMVHAMKDIIKKEKNTEEVFMFGVMDLNI